MQDVGTVVLYIPTELPFCISPLVGRVCLFVPNRLMQVSLPCSAMPFLVSLFLSLFLLSGPVNYDVSGEISPRFAIVVIPSIIPGMLRRGVRSNLLTCL